MQVDLLEKYKCQVSGKTNIMKIEDMIKKELERKLQNKEKIEQAKRDLHNKVLESIKLGYPRLFDLLSDNDNSFIELKGNYLVVFYETEIEYKIQKFTGSSDYWAFVDEKGNQISDDNAIAKLVREVAIYEEENYIDDRDSDGYWGTQD